MTPLLSFLSRLGKIVITSLSISVGMIIGYVIMYFAVGMRVTVEFVK